MRIPVNANLALEIREPFDQGVSASGSNAADVMLRVFTGHGDILHTEPENLSNSQKRSGMDLELYAFYHSGSF